jgi:chromate reductase, NAD(P)H dehydrogenase (quinone)
MRGFHILGISGSLRKGSYNSAALRVAQQLALNGVLIATLEYNYSISGMLKNTIDWISKITDQPFSRKPVAILGASMSKFGTARSQYDLRKFSVFLNAHFLN